MILKKNLTSYQKRLYKNYQDTLEVLGLNADSFLELIDGSETDSIIPVIKGMTDQVVRSEVILEYTLIDLELDFIISIHFLEEVRS